jgi:hypothetical protein
MSEFIFDEWIEVSNYQDFRVSHCVYFMADLGNSKQQLRVDRPVMTLNKSGSTEAFRFARKIQPKVSVIVNYKGHNHYVDVTDLTARKIIAGDNI